MSIRANGWIRKRLIKLQMAQKSGRGTSYTSAGSQHVVVERYEDAGSPTCHRVQGINAGNPACQVIGGMSAYV